MTFAKIAIVVALMAAAAHPQTANRTIAVTIDDLPVVSTRTDLNNRQDITFKLVDSLQSLGVPAIGFVNENKLYAGDKRDEKQIDLLRMWLAAGLELGNHTFSHRSLNQIPLADYEADLLKGETILSELSLSKGRKVRFFRHPFLQTGRTLEVKADFDQFLAKHGYRIAPVSFDNADYIFSRAYDIAFDRGDKALMKKVGDAYIPYMEAKLDYWERQSVKLFNREIPQIMLIHANSINSRYIQPLILTLKGRGYRFVDLETALKDDAYRLPDKFVGAAGISWLHRWALDRGRENILPDEPAVPEFVLKLSGFTSE